MERTVEPGTARRARAVIVSRRPTQAVAVLGICIVVILVFSVSLKEMSAATSTLEKIMYAAIH
jgi:hypothetical protein